MSISLNYGYGGRFVGTLDPARIVRLHPAPARLDGLGEVLSATLAHPLDFPPLQPLCMPGDRGVLALDRHTPAAAELVGEVWKVLERRGVGPESLHILQPVALDSVPQIDPR